MGAPRNAEQASSYNPALMSAQNKNEARNSPELRDLLSKFNSGELSLNDALSAAKGVRPNNANRSKVEGEYNYLKNERAKIQSQMEQLKQAAQKGDAGAAKRYRELEQDFKNTNDPYYNAERSLADLSRNDSTPADMSSVLKDMLATDSIAGSRIAADEVKNNPLLSGIFGDGGIQDQAEAEYGNNIARLDESREDLKGRGESYGLTANDLQAYGQGSDQITRDFAMQEQNLAQMLADRGLAQAPSGQAMQQFSGLYGNKAEQLARLQMDISQKRINTAKELAQARMNADLQRQAQTQGLIGGLGQLGNQATNDQYMRQLAGSQEDYNRDAGVAGLQMNNQGLQQNVNNSLFTQQEATRGPSLMEVLGGFAGGAAEGAASAFGAQSGKNAGNILFGMPKEDKK